MVNAIKGQKGFVAVPLEKRFWSRVDKSGDCWVWTAANDGRGYGQIHYDGRIRRATHASVFLTTGKWPPRHLMVCHHCDNPACVRPDHLFLGTMSENIKDAIRKGRHQPAGRPKQTHCKRGHSLSGDNLLVCKSGDRFCRACRKIREAARAALAESEK